MLESLILITYYSYFFASLNFKIELVNFYQRNNEKNEAAKNIH